MAVKPHSEWFSIYGFQIDTEGAATVQSICEYMEEAAGNHAAALGLSMERLHGEGVAWVLSRLRIVPEKLPPLNSRICVETWPVGAEGLQYRRDFVVRGEDGGIAARAASFWVVMNMRTRRVERVPDFIAAVALDNPATALEDSRLRPPALGPEHEARVFHARLADMDRNRHVNNVRYMDFVLESAAKAGGEGGPSPRDLKFLELAFKAEAYQNDAISARVNSFPPDEGRFCHSLVRKSDDKELVRAVSVFRR